jgi:hypothetical protein
MASGIGEVLLIGGIVWLVSKFTRRNGNGGGTDSNTDPCAPGISSSAWPRYLAAGHNPTPNEFVWLGIVVDGEWGTSQDNRDILVMAPNGSTAWWPNIDITLSEIPRSAAETNMGGHFCLPANYVPPPNISL